MPAEREGTHLSRKAFDWKAAQVYFGVMQGLVAEHKEMWDLLQVAYV